jgi:CDP-glycerol glycerophosphotransferase
MSRVLRFIGLFVKTDNNLILFVSFAGKSYNDSPKKIYEYMYKYSRYKDFKYVWAFEEPEELDISGCSKIKIDSIKYFIIALKAKYWVTNVNVERGLHFKKKNTVYLNTWHGIPIKKIGNAVSGRKDFDFSKVNFFCYSSQYEKKIFLRDLNVSEKSLLYSGMPRNDELWNISKRQINEYRKKIGIPVDKKVILYAPTWRDSEDGGLSYSLNPPININKWQEKLEFEYIMLFRAHVFVNELNFIDFNDFIFDLSSYPEINHLLFISDILISDYSSIIFDYSVLCRPIICFGYDYDEYIIKRGFYIDIKSELPSGVLETENQVIEKIMTLDYQEECKKTKQFRDKYVEVGGDATETCVNLLIRDYIE